MAVRGEISQAVADALKDAQLLPRDAGVVALVVRYAADLDAAPGDVSVLSDVGPKLLTALSALGMSPAGRGVRGGGQGANSVEGKLDELRERRKRRAP